MSCRNRYMNTFLGTECIPEENMPMDGRNSAMQYLKIINTNLYFNSNDRTLKITGICIQTYLSLLSFLLKKSNKYFFKTIISCKNMKFQHLC